MASVPPPPDGLDLTPAPPRRGLAGAPPVPWPWWEAILVYLIGSFLLGGGTAAILYTVSTGPDMEIVAGLAADLVFLAAMLSWLTRRCPDWRDRIRLRWDAREASIGFGLGLVLYPIVAIVSATLVAWLLEGLTGGPVEQPAQLPDDLSPWAKAVAVLLVVVVAPVVEELFYRGVLYRSLRDPYGRLVGIVVTSLLFGLAHFVPGPAADTALLQIVMVVTGLGLVGVYEWRGSLVANIFAHVAFNVIGVTLILGGIG